MIDIGSFFLGALMMYFVTRIVIKINENRYNQAFDDELRARPRDFGF